MMIEGILLPVFVLVALTFGLLFWNGGWRSGDVTPANRSGTGTAIDDPLRLDMLFYVLVALILPLRHAGLVMVMLAWVFVITRFVHAGVLVSGGAGNRGLAYISSALVLLAMWVYFALSILLGI
jgi:hypothetical protein